MASMLGGLLVGIISSSLRKVNELNFLKKLKMTVPAASGTFDYLTVDLDFYVVRHREEQSG